MKPTRPPCSAAAFVALWCIILLYDFPRGINPARAEVTHQSRP